MVDQPGNLVLVMLRRMDEKLDRLIDEVHGVKVRKTAVEGNLTGVHRIEARIEGIERRLDLVDAH